MSKAQQGDSQEAHTCKHTCIHSKILIQTHKQYMDEGPHWPKGPTVQKRKKKRKYVEEKEISGPVHSPNNAAEGADG